MSDIEQRLRAGPEVRVIEDGSGAWEMDPDTTGEIMREAADEITRLEADNASLRSKLEEAEGAAKIAVICDNEGVCLSGRWAGWLFRKHSDGQWVSVQKLELRDPFEGNPMIAALSALREADHA